MREYLGELVLDTAPASAPVTTAEAKSHLRVDISDDDTLIDDLVAGAREYFEEVADKTLFTTTWKLILDGWPAKSYIELPRPPLQSVTSVVYVDSDGNSNTFSSSSYDVETERTPGRIQLGYGKSWPSATLRPASPITITYVAGWSNVANIPERYKQAIKLMVGHWYENREQIMTTGAIPQTLPFGLMSILLASRTN